MREPTERDVDAFGRVCFLNHNPAGTASVTIECYLECKAFTFETTCPMTMGGWYKVRGKVKEVEGLRRDGKLLDRNTEYVHKPANGSPQSEWTFRMIYGRSDVGEAPPVTDIERVNWKDLTTYGYLLWRRMHDSNQRGTLSHEKARHIMRAVKMISATIDSNAEESDAPIIATPAISA